MIRTESSSRAKGNFVPSEQSSQDVHSFHESKRREGGRNADGEELRQAATVGLARLIRVMERASEHSSVPV
ncbi:hypothetical protein GUJ93_ZPchr0009g956 [Zizania palustris]|uniref:Uncharacterized protein n=1 Tax=Zizania palustris TaxID=103762 RepID=A0A8J5S3A7_ZIZPA|nr:hypothetical protein GUJ93_ZPchr0009g956 [Zizania palustris]